MKMYGTIFPAMTSNGRTGIANRFSIVPRSRSRVMARPVISTIISVRITPIRPGTMLFWLSASGLNIRCTCTSNGAGVGARKSSAPPRSLRAADRATVSTEPSAVPVATGSVASASTSKAGRSPRSKSRVKFAGTFTTNMTSPRSRAARPACSSGSSATTRK